MSRNNDTEGFIFGVVVVGGLVAIMLGGPPVFKWLAALISEPLATVVLLAAAVWLLSRIVTR